MRGLAHSCVLFVEDEEQLDKALEVREQLPALRWIVVFDMEGLHELPRPAGAEPRRNCANAGASSTPRTLANSSAAAHARKPDDLAILVYTSGTTGRPKGAMHSHRGLIYTVRGYNTLTAQDEHDERMCFLPLCHIAERLGGEYFAIYTGSVLNFVENPDTVPENVREIAPTVFTAVPRVWEKFYSAVIDRGSRGGPSCSRLLYALGDRRRRARRRPGAVTAARSGRAEARVHAGALAGAEQRAQADRHPPGALPGHRRSADLARSGALVHGARACRCSRSGGRPSRAAPRPACRPTRIKPGSIGPACPFNEVKLDRATGELLIRGPNVFMGYLNQPEKTAETIDADGWLHTGDVGTVDADGYFRITDRMKDIIITAGGKNITPSEIENELKFSPYITDAVVIGDKRPYLTVHWS